MKQQAILRYNLRKIIKMRGRYMALFALLLVAFSNSLWSAEVDTVWVSDINELISFQHTLTKNIIVNGGTGPQFVQCQFNCDVLEDVDVHFSKKSEDVDDNILKEYENAKKNIKLSFNTFVDLNNLNISITDVNIESLKISIYDINGKFVKSSNYNKNDLNSLISIDISDLNANLYIYEIEIDGTKAFINKFIKE